MGSPAGQVLLVFGLVSIAGSWYIRNGGTDGLLRGPTKNRRNALSLGFLALMLMGHWLASSVFASQSATDEIAGIVTHSEYTGRSLTGQVYRLRTEDGRTKSLGWERPEQLLAVPGDRVDIRFDHYSESILQMDVLSGKHRGQYLHDRLSDSRRTLWPAAAPLLLALLGLWIWFSPEPVKIDEAALTRRIGDGCFDISKMHFSRSQSVETQRSIAEEVQIQSPQPPDMLFCRRIRRRIQTYRD